jgi:hypothetical protein
VKETALSEIVIECDAVFGDRLRRALRAEAGKLNADPNLATILSAAKPRQGADGGAIMRWAFDIRLSVDLAKVLWESAAILLIVNPKIVMGGRLKKIVRSIGDLRELYKAISGKPAPASTPSLGITGKKEKPATKKKSLAIAKAPATKRPSR